MKLLFIIIMSLLTSCSLTGEDGKWNSFTPHPWLIRNIPDGDDSYSSGFRAGCNDSLGLSGYGGMRLLEIGWGDSIMSPLKYKYLYDPKRALADEQYDLGVGHGRSYCPWAANAVIGF